MKEVSFHLSGERTVRRGNFFDWRPLPINHIQFHTHPLSQAGTRR
jgi:hypothetical protein